MPGDTATLQPPGIPPPREEAGTGQDAPPPRPCKRHGRQDGERGTCPLTGPRTGPDPPVPRDASGHRTDPGVAHGTAPHRHRGPRPSSTHAAPAPATPASTRDPRRCPRLGGCPGGTAPAGAGAAPLTCSLAGVPGGRPLPALSPHAAAHGGAQRRRRRSAWGRAGSALRPTAGPSAVQPRRPALSAGAAPPPETPRTAPRRTAPRRAAPRPARPRCACD